jgi:hypothetical protein
MPRTGKSPDGVKYRSLCERCNKLLLGTWYDPTLIKLAEHTRTLLESSLDLPPTVQVRSHPQRLVRSVLGHLAAQGVDRYEKGSITVPLRDYLLDPAVSMPAGLRVHYWVYPHPGRVLLRDGVICNFGENKPSMLWLMKAYPLAFAVVWDRNFNFDVTFVPRDFDRYSDLGVDDEVDLPMDLRSVPSAVWPEAPTENTALLMGKEAIFASALPPRSRLIRVPSAK